MKTFIFTLAVFISTAFESVRAASPEEEANFLTAVRQAFDKQDTNALFTLTCWDRVPDRFIKSAKNLNMREIAWEISDLTLVNPDPNTHRQGLKGNDGVTYLPNLPVIKLLKIVFVKDGRFQPETRPVGEKDGKLYLLENAPVE